MTGCTATTLNAAKTRVDADIVTRDAAIAVEEARLGGRRHDLRKKPRLAEEAVAAEEEAAADGTPEEPLL